MTDFEVGNVYNGVLVGLDDFLFLYAGGQKQFDYLMGIRKPSLDHISNFISNLKYRNAFCSDRGLEYFHVVFPSKPVVMTEMIPDPYRSSVVGIFSKYYIDSINDNLLDYVLYPLDLLLQLKADRPVFYRTDTHLTDYGNLSVAKLILDRLGFGYKSDEFFYEIVQARKGDLENMLKVRLAFQEVLIRPNVLPMIYDNRRFLPGNSNNVYIVHNPRSISAKRLLIFGDSFIRDSIIYLSPVFRDIIYVRSPLFQSDIVDLVGADIVISSNAERYMASVDCDSQSLPFLFALNRIKEYTPDSAFVDAFDAEFSWRHHRRCYENWTKRLHVGL